MPTPLGMDPNTAKPIMASKAPEREWILCFFCGRARIRRRLSVNGLPHFTTYRGDTHQHPVCAKREEMLKTLDFEYMSARFHASMLNRDFNPHPGEGGDRKPPVDSELKVATINSLRDLVTWGLYLCPDFALNETERLSDMLLNNRIAPEFFQNREPKHLGWRAVVARLDSFNEEEMWIRYTLDYDVGEAGKKKVIFCQRTTSRKIYEELKIKYLERLEQTTARGNKVYQGAIIYGDWEVNGCQWCNSVYGKNACIRADGCIEIMFESQITQPNFVYPIKREQSQPVKPSL